MKSVFSYSVKLGAVLTALLFTWNQIIWANGIRSVHPYDLEAPQPSASTIAQEVPSPPLSIPSTTQNFLTNDFPLSPATPEAPDGQSGEELIQTESTVDGHTIFHVYENESIQDAIREASAGDTVFLHAGVYNQSVTLKYGVNLKGEDSATVILDGQRMFPDVILAQGDNVIEGVTVKGGAPYAGPKSAIRIEGSHVILRSSRVIDNADYGVYLRSGNNILIERVFFQNNHLAIQYPSAMATNVVIRYNTLVHNHIGINILSGVTPRIENNIITGSSFCAIYEFNWSAYASGQLSRGFAVVEDNLFSGNAWRPTAYGSSTPPAVENLTSGNIAADPQFHSDYSIPETSPAYGKGAFLPEGLNAVLDRVSSVGVDHSITPLLDGDTVIGYRALYEEGSVEEFYNDGRQALDTTPPEIVLSADRVFTNHSDYELVYAVDGVEKRELYHLTEGQNTFTLEAADIFGNKTTKTVCVMLDQIPPDGNLQVNDGNEETDSRTVVLTIDARDDSPLKDVRFSTNGGTNWTEWGEFSGMKVVMLSEGEGDKEVLCQLRDAAGNVVSFSDRIRFVSVPLLPVVQFLSPSSTNSPLYGLRYSINGIEQQETWQLQPGENQLMVRASTGAAATFGEYTVILNRDDAALPPMPITPSFSQGGMSLTASNGLILKYEGDRLVGIEKPGEFILLDPELSASQELTGGVLVFNNGDKLLFQNGHALYRENVTGDKAVYNENGTTAYMLTTDGQKIRFAYQYDGSGKTISIASFEEEASGLYDEKGRPVWIKKSAGTEIFYEDGFLTRYLDFAGNEYHYEVSILNEGITLTGYRSQLVSITPSGGTTTIPLETILMNLDHYPSIKGTLENEISRVMEYDAAGVMKRVVSNRGEILELRNGLPVSLMDASGTLLMIQSQMLEDPDLFYLSLEGNGFEQIFDSQGRLSGIRLSDGTLLNVTSLNLDQITLADGSILSELVWNGQSLTGFRRLNTDGSVDLFQDSYLTEHVDPAGNRTLYILYKEPGKFPEHKPSEIHMTDGRVYKIIEFTNAQGSLERINELVSMELPGGGRLEFENGAPVRYIQFKDVQLTAETVPELPYGQGYIPSMEFPEMELRGITINASGNILSGEILYRDGTQQLIRNGALYKQITPDGQVLEFDENFVNTWIPSEPVSPQSLTPEELAYRDRLIEKQLDFFRPGIGLHALTGLPLDNYQGNGSEPVDYSQSTLVGFWAEILVSIASGDHITSRMTQEEAFQKLKDLLDHYRQAQLEAGWNGMLAFFTIVETQENILDEQGQPTGETRTVIHYQNRFDQYGFGDTLNLSVSLSTVVGALQGRSLNASLSAMRDSILSTANSILKDQEAGYAAFYDPLKKKFHGAYAKDPQSGQWKFVKDFYIDRVFSEFRTGLIWLAAQYPQYRETIDHIDVAFRAYQRADGEIVDNVAPWDGGAFQMFWPQIHVDETQYPEFAVALRNFLYTQAEFVKKNGIAGFLSAGANPGQGYEGKIGVPYAAETDDPLYADIGSLYGLASAFSIAPHYVLQFFKNIEAAIPGTLTDAGWVDSIVFRDQTSVDPLTGAEIVTRSPVLATEYYGVDQASLVLSLLGTSRDYFSAYLDQTGSKGSFDSLYQKFEFNLTPVESGIPAPPDFGIFSGPLYTGTVSQPDGTGYAFTKEPAFVASLFDPDYGEGRLYNYRAPSGAFHHTEIEFTASTGAVTSMGLQEFLLLPGRRDAARSLFEGIHLNLFDRASAQGAFYTRGFGFANGALSRVAGMGEVQQVQFDLQSVTRPVGTWAQFQAMDLSDFDFISIPVKLSPDSDAAVRLKFELKGMGEVFVTPQLTQEWQYLQIPIKRPSSPLSEIAVVVQSMDGGPVKGEFLLGPMSSFKVRISNNINWQVLTGKTDEELKNLLKNEVLQQPGGGGLVTQEEVLENFVIDSEGKLVSGTLRKANGEIQFYQRRMLTKWIFPNGRTVLFEKGLAAIVIDLARGQLEEARFYYDQDLRGTIHSFVVQENDHKRIFNAEGQLESLVAGGATVHFQDGEIFSIETAAAILTRIVFADDRQILKAHVTMKTGSEFDIDQTQEQSTLLGEGVEIFYMNGRITAIETPQNGRTELSYDYDALGRMIGVNVSFQEVGRSVRTVMSLAEFLQIPGRELEKTHLLKPNSMDLISVSSVGGYSVGPSVDWRLIEARKEGSLFYDGAVCSEPACWKFTYNENSPPIGMALYHPPLDLIDYDFLSITIRLDPSVIWPQDFTLSIKDGYWARYSYAVEGLSSEYQTFVIPLAGKSWKTSQLTLEIHPGDRDPEAYGISGRVYLGDVSYYSVQTATQPLWENQIGISSSMIQGLKLEADDLSSVGTHIASRTALRYEHLAQYMDLPTYLRYQQEASGGSFQLENFIRFDGSRIDLEGQDVSRVILPDGTINECMISGNESQGMIHGVASGGTDTGMVQYSYGALRRITQVDGRQYDLSYEFDAEGKEITVLKDVLSGEERRFKDGRLISSTDPEQLQTRYTYENGELIGAELMYRNTVLNSTQYSFNRSETQVTDDRGTTWFYDANGNLIKHMTQDGFLYEYSEYTQPLMEGQTIDPDDYKSELIGVTGLRAVNLRGYQAADGSWIYWDGESDSEIHLCGGTQAVNLEFDAEQKIRSGQIQFSDGMILEIENFIPVRGRLASGQSFSHVFPPAESYELLQAQDGTYLGFRFKIGGRIFTYNAAGELTQVESEDGVTHLFSYTHDVQGNATGYTDLERRQVAFNGVPFPKEVELMNGTGQKLMDSGVEIATHDGNGFLIGVYKEATNQWDVYSGSFGSEADRLGLKHFLSEIKTGDSVAMTLSDPAFSQAGEEILVLLEGLGAMQVRQAATTNTPWNFFGNENLNKGQGCENLGASVFSTMAETSRAQSVSGGQSPVFEGVPILFEMEQAVAQHYSDFLKACVPLKAARDLQLVTVYNEHDEIVYTRRLDGVSSYYELGKVRETFDKDGTLLSVHEYTCPGSGCHSPEDMALSRITLTKVRQDFEAQAAQSSEQIEQAKFDALYRLAWQDEIARAQILESVNAGVAEINSRISSLESQRFQRVKECHRILFWKHCVERTYEVPGVQGAINQLAGQRSELIRTGEEQLAAIPGAMAGRLAEIEEATAIRALELQAQKDAFLLDILHEEMKPIVTDFYRRFLGRDVSDPEFDSWVNRFKVAGWIDTQVLQSALQDSPERILRANQKAAMVQAVRSFLESYLASSLETKTQMLQNLKLNGSEVVTLDAGDLDGILEWLESRDLHFGQSAFLSLQEMLRSQGAEVPMETIGKEAILIDILTGVITRFTGGDLLLSMFALDRTAAIHARDFASVKYTYDDLRALYQSTCGLSLDSCNLRVIAHVGEDHFVVVKKVTDTEILYEETGKGSEGSDVTLSKENFLKVWIAKDNAGFLMISEEQAVASKKLSDPEAREVRGAFFLIDDIIFWSFVASVVFTVASVAVSFFSPALGKILGYAALVAGIVGIVASIGQFVVQGLKMVFSNVAQNGLFATIKQGFAYVGKVLWEPVRAVGRFIQNGFQFLKSGFSGGFGSFGAGITQIKNFLLSPAQEILTDGVLSGYKFTYAQIAARQLVAAGLNFTVSKGLEGLGLSPQLCQLAGAFVGGGFLGIGQAGSSFIRSGLQQFILQGVSEIGLRIGLPPPITSALSLIASTSLNAFFDPNLTLHSGLFGIVPQLASQFTMGGLELLGRSMGLDPFIAQLIGFPLSAITSRIVTGYMQHNPFEFSTYGIFNLIKEAILNRNTLGGIFSIGAQFLIDRFDLDDSLLGSAAGRLVAGIFRDFIDSPLRFSFVDSIIKSTEESLYQFLDPMLLPQIFTSILDNGFAAGIEKYAIALFNRETLLEFTSAGISLGQWIENGLPTAEDIIYEGESAKQIRLTRNGKTIQFVYIPRGLRLEIRAICELDEAGNASRVVQWETDSFGKITEVVIEEQMGQGVIRRDILDPSGRIKEIIFKDWDDQVYGRLSFNDQGAIEFTNYSLGISNYLTGDGRFGFDFSIAPDLQDLNQLLYDFNANLDPEEVALLSAFTYGNGFWNSRQSPDSVSTLMATFMGDMEADQGRNGTPGIVLFDAGGNIARDRHGNILTTASLPVTLYEETGLVGNILRWMADALFGCNFMRDEIERELTKYFDLIKLNQEKFNLDPNIQFVHFAHSGNFQPMVEALEHMGNEYRSRIKTLIVYEGPYVGDGVIDDPYLETIIRVRGSESGLSVPFIDHRDFKIQDQNGNVTALQNQYNIEIVGAGHLDFSYDPSFEYGSAEAREIAIKTSLFMRELTLKANDLVLMQDFLRVNRSDNSITLVDGVYRVDISKFESGL